MNVHIKKFRDGFRHGYTQLTKLSRNDGIEFGILRMKKGESIEIKNKDNERCYVLLHGNVRFISDSSGDFTAERKNLLDENPSTFLGGKGTHFILEAKISAELACVRVKNNAPFKTTYFPPQNVETDLRGKGKLDDTAFRRVRTIFDKRTMPQSNLVVGEVLTHQGRWSSYPPHHHPQPEIYFYRFFPEEGYGFAQVGEDVYKVENNDLINITPGKDHPQVAAPGYTMWYLWVIRHLLNKPYIKPEFTKKHKWAFENENPPLSPFVKGGRRGIIQKG